MNVCVQSCFVRSPVLGGLFGVVVPSWNIGVDSAERACCQISLARSSAALQGPGQPSCSSHKPFHVPQPQAKSGASLLLQHQRMCLPNSWDMMTVASLPRVKKERSRSLRVILLLISILNFLCLSCLSFSLCPPVPILVCVSLIITFWYWHFPEVTDHWFSYHMCFFAMFFSRSLSPLFIMLSFSALYVTSGVDVLAAWGN